VEDSDESVDGDEVGFCNGGGDGDGNDDGSGDRGDDGGLGSSSWTVGFTVLLLRV
jgi:hypothetical protein